MRALWVVDMYRYMIEHPQWLPAKRPGRNFGHVSVRREPRDESTASFASDRSHAKLSPLAELSAPELRRRSESPNGCNGNMVQRLLVREEAASCH